MEKKSIKQILQHTDEMIEKGKINESVGFLRSLEPISDYTILEKAFFYFLNCKSCILSEDIPKAHVMVERGVLFAKQSENCKLLADLLLLRAAILVFYGEIEEGKILFKECTEVLQKLPALSEKDLKRRKNVIGCYTNPNFSILAENIEMLQMLKETVDILEVDTFRMEEKRTILLHLADIMIVSGKIDETRELLNFLGDVNNFTLEQKADFYEIQRVINMIIKDLPKAHEMGKKAVKFARDGIKSDVTIGIFINYSITLINEGKYNESIEILNESFEMIQKINNLTKKQENFRVGSIHFWKGYTLKILGKIEQAIEEFKNAIKHYEEVKLTFHLIQAYWHCSEGYTQIGMYGKSYEFYLKSQQLNDSFSSSNQEYWKMTNIFKKGSMYSRKGELHLALESYKDGLFLARKYRYMVDCIAGLTGIGYIYGELGKKEKALEFHNEAMNIAKKNKIDHVGLLKNLFDNYVSMNDLSSAKEIFHQIEKIWLKYQDNKVIDLMYHSSKAILLKISGRTRDLAEAQEIFQSIANEEVTSLYYTQNAILNLSEMLIDEFKNSQKEEILYELTSFLEPLQITAKKHESYKILAETYLLSAKLNMLQFNFTKARNYLTKAQTIAENQGFNAFAIRTSNEHDEFLQNLEIWEQMKKDNLPIVNQIVKTKIMEQISINLKKRPEEENELSSESPILLLLMANSGNPIYTKVFNSDWNVNETLFSSFLAAFNSFSGEIFSEGLDRAKFGKFKILMAGIPPLMSCYVFEGQSFLAHQKFAKFNENIHKSGEIWSKLERANQKNQVMQQNSSKEIEQLIHTIF